MDIWLCFNGLDDLKIELDEAKARESGSINVKTTREKLLTELARHDKEIEKRKRAAEVEKHASWDAFMKQDVWDYEVKDEKATGYDGLKLDGIRITKRLKPSFVTEWRRDWGGLISEDSCEWHGMFYYRTKENIVTTYYGGTYVLKSVPFIADDDLWDRFRNGDIPKKYLN